MRKVPIHIPLSARCDSIRDCFDQSDEVNCSLDTHFYCQSGPDIFVPKHKVSVMPIVWYRYRISVSSNS